MKIILMSGCIGSGKSSLLQNQKFLKKFPKPWTIISLDHIAKEYYYTPLSQYFFQKNPYIRKIYSHTPKIFLSRLKKQLFFSPFSARYWSILEDILHPQIRQYIVSTRKKFQKKKGSLFFECPLPEKLFPEISGNKPAQNIKKVTLLFSQFAFLRLIHTRKMKPQEISGILNRQHCLQKK